jgi:hypothetical protein
MPGLSFRPTEFGKFGGAQSCLVRQEEFVELRRAHRRAAQHGVSLATMMDLMLKEMEQHVIHPFALNARSAVQFNDALKAVSRERLHDRNQPAVNLLLCLAQSGYGFARLLVRPGCQAKFPALHRIHVKAIDNENMIEGGHQAWEETDSRRREFGV